MCVGGHSQDDRGGADISTLGSCYHWDSVTSTSEGLVERRSWALQLILGKEKRSFPGPEQSPQPRQPGPFTLV